MLAAAQYTFGFLQRYLLPQCRQTSRDKCLAVHATSGVGLSAGHPGDRNQVQDALCYRQGQRTNLAATMHGLYLGTLVRVEPVVQPACEQRWPIVGYW
jgi:hypothetical protein